MMPVAPIIYGGQRVRNRAFEKDAIGLEDLEVEVEHALRILESTPSRSPRNTIILGKREREAPQEAERGHLEDAIIEAVRTLEDPELGYYNRPHYLTNLLLALQLRYKRTYATQDPKEDGKEGANEGANEGDTQAFPNYLRHETLWNNQDFDFRSSRHQDLPASPALFFRQLIQNAQRDVDAISVDGDDAQNLLQLQVCLQNLVVAYRRRYERVRQIEDIECAAEIAQQAVDFLSPHEQLRAGFLYDLASTLLIQCELTQAGEDLERAVDAAQEAVDATSSKGHFRAACLNTLGLALMERYTQKADIKDLDAAIGLLREAISISILGSLITDESTAMWNGPIPPGNVVGASRQEATKRTYVGINGLMRVTAHANDLVYLNQTGGGAILGQIIIIRKTTILQRKWWDEVEQSLEAAQKALDSTPKSHPTWAEWSDQLGDDFRRRYELRGQGEDIDNAVDAFHKTVELTPTDFPGRADRLLRIGWA